MADEQSTQVLDFLREQFARMDARFDESDRRQREMLAQLVRIEAGQGKLRRDQADDAATVIELDRLLDRAHADLTAARFLRSCDELDRLLDRAHADLAAARVAVEKLALSADAGMLDLRLHIDAGFDKVPASNANVTALLGELPGRRTP